MRVGDSTALLCRIGRQRALRRGASRTSVVTPSSQHCMSFMGPSMAYGLRPRAVAGKGWLRTPSPTQCVLLRALSRLNIALGPGPLGRRCKAPFTAVYTGAACLTGLHTEFHGPARSEAPDDGGANALLAGELKLDERAANDPSCPRQGSSFFRAECALFFSACGCRLTSCAMHTS